MMTIKKVFKFGLVLVLSTSGCGPRHEVVGPLLRARTGQCEALALIGRKSFVVQVEPDGEVVPSWTPNVAVLTAVSETIERMNLCPEQATVAVETPDFDMYVVQIVGVHGDSVDVAIFSHVLMSELVPWICHEHAVDGACGLAWHGSVDVSRHCISRIHADCEYASPDTR